MPALVQTPAQLYEHLGQLLEQGDDVLLRNGPAVLQQFLSLGDFLNSFRVHVEPGSYRRPKVLGEEGKHVLRLMQWNAVTTPYHAHHGRPCLTLVLDGEVTVEDAWMQRKGNQLYILTDTQANLLTPGMVGVVNPKVTEIHRVICTGQATTLNLYPEDHDFAICYSHAAGYYQAKRCELPPA